MNELENVMTFGEKMQQFDNAILLVKEYKKMMRDLLMWIRHNYTFEDLFKDYIKCDRISKALSKLNLTLEFEIGNPKITLVNNLDKSIKMSIRLLMYF